ncbi:MAG TPA: hypothetical protein VMZ91_15075 [Candidatus Paceibacterota bacterium]|nr:hypothetical protein [Candidatus Paceibacterota bacterium]
MKLKEYMNEGKKVVAKFKKDGKLWELSKEFRWGGFLTHVIYVDGKEVDQLAPNLDPKIAIKEFMRKK